MVEELTEEREGRVEGRREARVRGHVADLQGLPCRRERQGVAVAIQLGQSRRRDGRWVGGRLVDDQVADHPGLGVEDAPSSRLVGGRVANSLASGAVDVEGHWLRVTEDRWYQAREGLVRGPEVVLTREQVVAGTVHGAQPPREHLTVGAVVRNLVGPGPEKGPARVGRSPSGDVPLRNLDLLEQEVQVTPVQHEAGAHGRGVRGSCHEGRRHQGADHQHGSNRSELAAGRHPAGGGACGRSIPPRGRAQMSHRGPPSLADAATGIPDVRVVLSVVCISATRQRTVLLMRSSIPRYPDQPAFARGRCMSGLQTP